jgi:hypothetical protein
MYPRSRIVAGLVCATAVGVAAFLSSAGPINPPAGPIAPTNKTLVEIEPRIAINATNTPGDATSTYIITQPGSYYLTENLAGEVGKAGILLMNHNITIDLNGYTMLGTNGASTAIDIFFNSLKNIVVRNGTITNWDGDGVDLGGANSLGSLVEDVFVSDVDLSGIKSAVNGIIRNCHVSNTGGSGFVTNDRTSAVGCVAENTANGFIVGEQAAVESCISRTSSNVGFQIDARATVTACSAYSGGSAGFRLVGVGARLEENFASTSGNGFEATFVGATNNFFVRNVATANGVAYNLQAGNFAYAIQAGSNAVVDVGGTPWGTSHPWANIKY